MVVVAPSPLNNRPRPHLMWKRETHGDKAVASAGTGGSGASNIAETSKSGFQKFEDKIGITDLATKTGLTHWQVFGIFILIVLIVLGLVMSLSFFSLLNFYDKSWFDFSSSAFLS